MIGRAVHAISAIGLLFLAVGGCAQDETAPSVGAGRNQRPAALIGDPHPTLNQHEAAVGTDPGTSVSGGPALQGGDSPDVDEPAPPVPSLEEQLDRLEEEIAGP